MYYYSSNKEKQSIKFGESSKKYSVFKLNLRIRLSSLNPLILSDKFLDILKHTNICPHFHISLQFCADIILKKMKRFYSVANVYKGIGKLQKARPNSFIGGDVIVGFPGETDLLFKETKKNLENLKFTKLHVFPFSRRPGTEAYNYSDKVPERVWIYL